MYVIIMAGSLPTLRPLVQWVRTKSTDLANKQKASHSSQRNHEVGHPRQKFANIYDAAGHPRYQRRQQRDIELDSVQSILESRITKTTHVKVSYEADRTKRHVHEWEQNDVSKEPIHALERV